METKYYIKDECIYFNCEFNESLDNYINVMKNCKKIIFSNYYDYVICIQTKNHFDPIYFKNIKNNKFNQPLNNCFDHQTQLKELFFGFYFNHPLNNSIARQTQLVGLTFGNQFNKPLGNSLNNLTQLEQLTFGCYFNKPLTNSLNHLSQLSQLTFGYYFNQPLTNSITQLTQLVELTLGNSFNQELNIPPNIKKLKLDCNNINLIDNLPNSIEELNFGLNFYLPLTNLPNSIKIISIDQFSKYNKELNNLPHFLEKLYLPFRYNKEIKNINSQCIIMMQKIE